MDKKAIPVPCPACSRLMWREEFRYCEFCGKKKCRICIGTWTYPYCKPCHQYINEHVYENRPLAGKAGG